MGLDKYNEVPSWQCKYDALANPLRGLISTITVSAGWVSTIKALMVWTRPILDLEDWVCTMMVIVFWMYYDGHCVLASTMVVLAGSVNTITNCSVGLVL